MKSDYKNRAHRIGYEWIPARDGSTDVCLRPAVFEDGIKQVTHYPDPCEFTTADQAAAELDQLETAAP